MSIESRCCALLLFSFLPCTAFSFAQQGSPADQASDKVYLDVVVAPRSGPPISGLDQKDFTVLDNKTVRPITSFRALGRGQAPIEVILLIDAVNASYQSIVYERQEIDRFLRANNGHLANSTSLVIFTDNGTKVQEDATSDGNALSTSLDQAEIGLRTIRRSSGIYGADERLELSLKTLHQLVIREATQPGRKIILWVSPGWPLLSGARTDLSTKQQRQIFADVVSLSTTLRQAGITLYSIDPSGAGEEVFRSSYYEEFLKGISKPNDTTFGDLGLQVLATQTGGLALTASNDITAQLQRCVADAAAYYELSFDPPPGEHPDEYHHLEVKVAKPGLVARTRQGYYAQP